MPIQPTRPSGMFSSPDTRPRTQFMKPSSVGQMGRTSGPSMSQTGTSPMDMARSSQTPIPGAADLFSPLSQPTPAQQVRQLIASLTDDELAAILHEIADGRLRSADSTIGGLAAADMFDTAQDTTEV